MLRGSKSDTVRRGHHGGLKRRRDRAGGYRQMARAPFRVGQKQNDFRVDKPWQLRMTGLTSVTLPVTSTSTSNVTGAWSASNLKSGGSRRSTSLLSNQASTSGLRVTSSLDILSLASQGALQGAQVPLCHRPAL